MDFSELVNKRQSDRKYQQKPVDRALLLQCLEAARVAPSACNSQPWTVSYTHLTLPTSIVV